MLLVVQHTDIYNFKTVVQGGGGFARSCFSPVVDPPKTSSVVDMRSTFLLFNSTQMLVLGFNAVSVFDSMRLWV